MKKSLLTLLGCLALAAPASALEKRTFTSADGSKTFEGTLTDYDEKRETVTVRKTGTKTVTFKLNLLSEADIKYVKDNGNALVGANALRLDFDLWKDKPLKKQAGIEKTTTTPAGYTVEVRNWTKKDVDNVKIRYTIFHRKDAENDPGSIAQTTGSFEIETLFAKSDVPQRTEPVNLVRYSREKSGGG